MTDVTVRVLNETATTRKAFKWIYVYVHPLDECANGGSSWEVTHREFAPGLIYAEHPRCSRCGGQPVVDSFRKEADTGFVPWAQTKEKLATARAQRETEPVYDDGRFDEV